jgi:hypothetical protein
MEDMNVPNDNTIMDEVVINLNMFDALVLDKVAGEVDVTNVVAVD